MLPALAPAAEPASMPLNGTSSMTNPPLQQGPLVRTALPPQAWVAFVSAPALVHLPSLLAAQPEHRDAIARLAIPDPAPQSRFLPDRCHDERAAPRQCEPVDAATHRQATDAAQVAGATRLAR
uniref:Uncharacterized protein n=1 Tax=Chlamydomonas euryale TaxID=1486919 RepID=A0A7R9VKE5_9CHLO|eukprot:352129-Chlamydomonas_euryale.AAC.16